MAYASRTAIASAAERARAAEAVSAFEAKPSVKAGQDLLDWLMTFTPWTNSPTHSSLVSRTTRAMSRLGNTIPPQPTQTPRSNFSPFPTTAPTANPYADRDARIVESQRLAAARKATSTARPTTRATATGKNDSSGFDWTSITSIVGSIAGAANTIIASQNPQPVAIEPESTGMGKSVAVVGGITVAGILFFLMLRRPPRSTQQ